MVVCELWGGCYPYVVLVVWSWLWLQRFFLSFGVQSCFRSWGVLTITLPDSKTVLIGKRLPLYILLYIMQITIECIWVQWCSMFMPTVFLSLFDMVCVGIHVSWKCPSWLVIYVGLHDCGVYEDCIFQLLVVVTTMVLVADRNSGSGPVSKITIRSATTCLLGMFGRDQLEMELSKAWETRKMANTSALLGSWVFGNVEQCPCCSWVCVNRGKWWNHPVFHSFHWC